MADLGEVLSAATAYGDARVAEETAELQAELSEAQADINLLESQYAELKAEFDAYKAADPGGPHPGNPDPPPPTTETVFGASDGDWPIPGVDKLPGIRCYLGPGQKPATWQDSAESRNAINRTVDGGVIWISWKVDDPDWLDRFMASKPANRIIIGTYNHEPENDSPPDVAGYQAAWKRALPVLKKHNVLSATCLLGHMTDAQNEPFWVDGVDLCGFDRYNPGLGNAKSYTDPEKVFSRVLAYAAKKGCPLAIGETGTIVVPGSQPADRAEWARKMRAHLTRDDVHTVLWWNQSHMAIDSQVSAVWFD